MLKFQHYLLLLFLSVSTGISGSAGYLSVSGGLALRFREPSPPPATPPKPPKDTATKAENDQASVPLKAPEPTEALAMPQAVEVAKVPKPLVLPQAEPQELNPPVTRLPTQDSKQVKYPPAILPDDTRVTIKAEDFLPIFVVPGTKLP